MHSDQTRKYGISESKIQALIMTVAKGIIDSEMHNVLSAHYASSAWCIMRHIYSQDS